MREKRSTPSQQRGATRAQRALKREKKTGVSAKRVGRDLGQFKRWFDKRYLLAWWQHHIESALESLRRLRGNPWQNLLTILVLGIAMALPASLQLTFANLERLVAMDASQSRISVFLQLSVTESQREQIAMALAAEPLVDKIISVSADEAMQQFSARHGMSNLAAGFDQNPLPASFELTLKHDADPEKAAAFVAKIESMRGIDDVLFDQLWLQRFHSLLNLGRTGALWLTGVLLCAVLLVIGNTIRLLIENRRDEIALVKLVGGTDAFVRRPFLYFGVWLGVGAGVIALCLLNLGVELIQPMVDQVASLYYTEFVLQRMMFSDSGAMLMLAAISGWLGAFIAVVLELDAIQPD